MLYTL